MEEAEKLEPFDHKSLTSINDANWKNEVVTQQNIIAKLLYPDPRHQSPTNYSVPSDCPISLEPLCPYDNLIIHRRPENAIELSDEHSLLAFVQYDIVNSEGKQLYVAVEQTTQSAVAWIRDARLFNICMYDHDCRKVLTIKRHWTCWFCFAQYYCFFCTFGFRGCGNKVVVTLCNGNQRLGHISQNLSFQQQTCLDIYDKDKKHVMSIFGRLADGIFDITLPEDEEDPIAMIETSMTPHEMSDFYKIKFSEYEDPYGITFFSPEVTPSHKALLISAVILMDYIFCKTNGDYPSFVQFIPTDFKSEPASHEKVFKDMSKEIIVTSMRPRHHRRTRLNRKCGCCRWFLEFICLFCSLGMARNSVRCIQLIFFIVIVLLVVLGIVFHIWPL